MTSAQRVLFRAAGSFALLVTTSCVAWCGEATANDGVDSKTAAAPATSQAAGERTFTREQAIAELEKFGGRFFRDEKQPGKPIQKIRLQDNRVVDAALEYLKAFPEVPKIEIVYFNHVTDAGMVYLAGLKNIQALDLEGTQISDTGIEHLKGLTNLRYLKLTNTGVTGAGMVHLKGLSQLQKLYLSFTDVTDDGLEQLAHLQKLRLLELDDTKVTAAGVSKLQKALPKCRIVSIASVAVESGKGGQASINRTANQTEPSGEWPDWRGPNRDGVSRETGLLQEWPAEGPPLKYDAPGIGWGYSTIVIQNGRMFTSGKFGKPAFLYAHNASDGSKLWQTQLCLGEVQTPCATPTVAGEFVYALSAEGELLCAESANGKEVWRNNFFKDFGGMYMAYKIGGAYSESVLVDGDLVICTPGGRDAFLVALNKKTGNVVWKVPIPANCGPQGVDAAGFSSPVVSNGCGIRQYVQMTGRGLISVAAADGKVLWTYNRIANTYNNIATPIVAGDYVFASTSHAGDPDTGTALVKLVPGDGGIKAEEVYRLPERIVGNHHGGMIHVGDYVYMGHGYNRGFPLCLEMKTGKIAWRPGRGAGSGSASLVYADGHLYFHYEDGVVALVEANPAAYRLKGKFKLPEQGIFSWAHPVVTGGCLYIRGGNRVFCYDVRAR